MQIAVVNQKTKIDPVALLGCVRRQPGNEQRNERGGGADHDAEGDELDDRAPAHWDPSLVEFAGRARP